MTGFKSGTLNSKSPSRSVFAPDVTPRSPALMSMSTRARAAAPRSTAWGSRAVGPGGAIESHPIPNAATISTRRDGRSRNRPLRPLVDVTRLLGGGWSDRGRIPVLVGLAVDEAPGVEPGRVVLRTGLPGIRVLARHEHGDVVVVGNHGDDLRGQLVALVLALDVQHFRKEGDDARETGRGVGIVLVIGGGEPFPGAIPLSALEQFAHDVEARLLVPVERRIRILEQRLGILHP